MSYLTNVINLCGTYHICNYSPYDIDKIFISGILPRDECYSMNRLLIKEINTILKCKCAFHCFDFIEQGQGWTENNETFDPSLFCPDQLDLIQKGNIQLSESIITATETQIVVSIPISTR